MIRHASTSVSDRLVCYLIRAGASGGSPGARLKEIEEAEPGRYLELPRAESRDGYEDMQAFIDTVDDTHLQELLGVAIQGRGAFRRFKDALARHPAEQQRWFEFQTARLDARAREWLAERGLSPT
jgi:hypothetical protein